MVVYNFKKIQVVPSSSDFVEVVLSKTQRKTPTVVHPGYAIARIRAFYIRKVKFAAQSFHDRLGQILTDFPHIEELHPFYADLVNVLYDRDHYKLALGQLNHAKNLIDNIAKDYVRLLKYGDSLYRCKQLKRAALGRMCTLMKRHTNSLGYLEQVRQHMARLPSIDPSTRTLIIAGFPNVGKSSFINKITRADVDVQPYAFTTKSLFVGHTDYNYLRWQVIDTPGILDHALEERNTIEMQAITALAHLRAAILFFVDPSEQCGYTLAQQNSLFRSLAPLFSSKPLVVVANKTDLGWEDELDADSAQLLRSFTERGADDEEDRRVADLLIKTSTMDETGVMEVRNKACDLLLEQRVDMKVKSRRAQASLNRLHLAIPSPESISADRTPCIPATVLEARAKQAEAGSDSNRRLERDLEIENGGPGVYSMDWRKLYELKERHWAYDIIPEIVDGKNIADFVDPEIEAKLEELEREEEARIAAVDAAEAMEPEYLDLPEDQKELLQEIRRKRALMKMSHDREKAVRNNRPSLTRTQASARGASSKKLEQQLREVGMESEDAKLLSSKLAKPVQKKRKREELDSDEENEAEPAKRPARDQGLRNQQQVNIAEKLARRKSKKMFVKDSRKGVGDRHIYNEMPRHLFAGKRKKGKTQRR
mmetsp:Transcript_18661/g.39231  ORF Transcript_18661/g.39231 Transcript_18661/m.39231 type:complete len:652 (-) Transcript_18661:432-2387(-)|eukprot:CAMPEP_0184682048 /NCGR_PEP_ID=MMETSP0312-20130426/5578_1 /TAXON_ID=31354 /ORGANISM="Compsopogon coeruleus, Strain SAG 36.94" /LENGTH=651 /DNA_ID=CAMNT_0027133351 /DNA_START=215 /DNA_END=2170 /DNA_ORIENTATION=-